MNTRLGVALFFVVGGLFLSGCPCENPTEGELTPFSGRYGYYVEGPWGFEGALTKETLDDAEWKLEGSFQFPTSGYLVMPAQIEILESYPEQVHITFQVFAPGSNQMVLQVISEVPVEATIAASNEAVFSVSFQSMCLRPETLSN